MNQVSIAPAGATVPTRGLHDCFREGRQVPAVNVHVHQGAWEDVAVDAVADCVAVVSLAELHVVIAHQVDTDELVPKAKGDALPRAAVGITQRHTNSASARRPKCAPSFAM